MTRRFACLTHALAGKHFTKAGGRGTNNPLVFDRLCKGSLVSRGMGGRLPGGSAWQRLQQASQPPPSPESFFRSLATCVPDKAGELATELLHAKGVEVPCPISFLCFTSLFVVDNRKIEHTWDGIQRSPVHATKQACWRELITSHHEVCAHPHQVHVLGG